jgi:hypothetical protein
MLHVNSWAAAGGSPSNFTQPLSRPISGVKAVHFLSVTLPNLIPPFNTFDQTITLQFDGVTSTDYPINISTTRFFTDVASFVSYINALCAASSYPRVRTVSFAFDSTTSRLTMTDTGGSVRPKPYDDGATTEGNWRIGFPQRSYAFQASHVATGYPAVILRTNCVKVHCNLIGSSLSALQSDADVIYSVPVDVNVGQMINYQNPYSEISLPCYIDNLSSVTVRLTDDDNIELSLPSNAYVSIQLLLDTQEA